MAVFRELAQHILDIFENGVRAGADLQCVIIEEDLKQDHLTIVVEDNGSGMSPEIVRRITDPWVTTRTTRKVGLGIPFLKQTAEMCEGDFEITSEPGVGTRTRATFRHSHIDRPPLGDIVSTVTCMIVGYPQVDVVYRHVVDGREFVLDTREIREVLGDEVPLSHPDVLAYLRSSLEEGLGELYEVAPSVG
jgi:hypothetical protein